MSTQVRYSSVLDIPPAELPCYEDADGVLRLCDFCHVDYIERYIPNDAAPSAGELCAGCGFRSSGAKQDALNRVVNELTEAVMAGATERDIAAVCKEVRWTVGRERWKDEQRMLPPTSPSRGFLYGLAHKSKLVIRRVVRGH